MTGVGVATTRKLATLLLPVLFATLSQAADLTGPDDRLKQLPADQRVLAERMTDFLKRMDDKYFARFAAGNGGGEEEGLQMAGEYSDYDIRVTRGPVFEKAGRMFAAGKHTNPALADRGQLVWGRFYSIDIHPKTPLVGMLHATIVMQFYANGRSEVGGWLDMMPGTRIDEDIARLGEVVDAHFTAHDKDPAIYRRLMCKGTHDTVAEFRRKPSCAGVSFYGPPVYPGNTERSYEFVAALFDRFVDTYVDIVGQRADQPFTPADLAAQDAMRKQWLIDQLYSDPFSSKTVPFQAWWLANVPPVVKF